MSFKIVERDEVGRVQAIYLRGNEVILTPAGNHSNGKSQVHLLEFLAKVFLPAGWPESVSPDYLQSVIW